MRKPNQVQRSALALSAIALLAITACNRSNDTATNVDSAIGMGGGATASATPGGGNMSARFRREMAAAGAPAVAVASAPLMASEEAMSGKSMSDQSRPASSAVMATPAPPNAPASFASDADERSSFVRGTPLPSVDPTGAMLVRHGQASVEVKAVDDAVTKVRQTAAQFGGYVANTAIQSGKDEQRSATLELRVPSGQFDALLAALSGLGKVESVTVGSEDVAEEYVDLGARAANARRVEARLVEMLASRTGKLSDVLTVEQELARVRQETERYDARLRWLERRATLSSLSLAIHERLPLLDNPRGPGPIAEAFAEAWTRMLGVIAWCIAALGALIPLGVLIGVVVVVARRLLRGRTPPGVSEA